MKKRILRKWVVVTLDMLKWFLIALLFNLAAWLVVRYSLDRVIARDNGQLGYVQDHYGK